MSIATLPTPPVAPVTITGPLAGLEAVVLHALHREAGGVARRCRAPSRRTGDIPLGSGTTQSAGSAHVLGIAAVVRDADVVAGADDRIARLEARIARRHDRTDSLDAADAREAPDDLARAGRGQRILEVDAGEGGPDHHLARVQLVQRQLDQPRLTLPSSLKMRYALNFAMRFCPVDVLSPRRLAAHARCGWLRYCVVCISISRLRGALDVGLRRHAGRTTARAAYLAPQDELDVAIVELVHQPGEAAHALRHARGGTAARPRARPYGSAARARCNRPSRAVRRTAALKSNQAVPGASRCARIGRALRSPACTLASPGSPAMPSKACSRCAVAQRRRGAE